MALGVQRPWLFRRAGMAMDEDMMTLVRYKPKKILSRKKCCKAWKDEGS